MASIDFTHAIYGALTLASGYPTPGDEFQNWVPDVRPIGPDRRELGSGLLRRYVHRTDYTAAFELAGIPNTETELGTALVLMEHLRSGGTCAVTTDDTLSHTYPLCALAPGTDPVLEAEPEYEGMWFRLRLTLLNVDVSPTLMVCRYH